MLEVYGGFKINPIGKIKTMLMSELILIDKSYKSKSIIGLSTII